MVKETRKSWQRKESSPHTYPCLATPLAGVLGVSWHKQVSILNPQQGSPWWLRWLSVCLQCWRPGFVPWVGKIPWRRKWQPTLFWKIPWTKEPGRLQSMRLQRVGDNCVTLLTQSLWGIVEPQIRAQSSFFTHFGTSLSFYIHTQAHCRINKVKQKTCIPRKRRGWSSECSYLVLKILDEPPRW